MRAIVYTLSAILFFTAGPLRAEDKAETCAQIADLAASIMDGRQEGVSRREALTIANASDEAIRPMLRDMVAAVYQGEKFPSQKAKRRAVDQTCDEANRACLRALR